MESHSRALAYVQQKAWAFKESGADQINVEICPICGNSNYKFYINGSGGPSDGLFDCKVCGEKGSLYQLKLKVGDATENITSLKDAGIAREVPAELPNVGALHRELMNNAEFADVLDWLVCDRGFTTAVLEEFLIGAEYSNGKKWVVIPHLDKNREPVYVKYRSVPPSKKEFRSSPGREVQLYNGGIIAPGLDNLTFVEGEFDCLSCLSKGIGSVVGVPGANTKKTTWVTRVDDAKPKKIYLLYDNDKVGQDAAKEMSKKLSSANVKVYNIKLPEFLCADGLKKGKDINEWFQAGNTLDQFRELQAAARPFDVDGVQDTATVIGEILTDIENRGTQRWDVDSPWLDLNAKLGGAAWGEVIGIMAEGKVGKTTMGMDWLDYLVEKYSIPAFMLCLEMKPKSLVRKWISFKTQTDDTPGKSAFTKQTVLDGLEVAKNLKADLLFGFCRVGRSEEVFDLIRQAVRRYGVKVVCFDNLQFLIRSLDHAAQETARMSKQFKELAMELNILILLIVQPNRVREGEIVAARNANGSSAIEKDVDAMITLHRNRVAKIKADDFTGFLDADDNFEPQMLVRVDLSRYAPGGVCTLMVDGGRSTIRNFATEDHSSIVHTNPGVILTEGAPVSV